MTNSVAIIYCRLAITIVGYRDLPVNIKICKKKFFKTTFFYCRLANTIVGYKGLPEISPVNMNRK